MSREQLAPTMTPDGPEDVAQPGTPADRPSPGCGRPRWAPPTSGPLLVLLLTLAVATAGGVAGWAGERAWAGRPAASGPAGRADAVATGPVVVSPEEGRTTVSWTVVVANPGPVDVQLHAPTPSRVAADEPGFLSAWPRTLTVPAGGSGRIAVVTVVPCVDDAPLVAPRVELRRPGRPATTVPVTGALDVAVQACAGRPAESAAVVLDGVEGAGADLTLVLRSPTGRTWRVLGAAVGGLRLTAIPADVTGAASPLFLRAPAASRPGAGCPTDWSTLGVPQHVDLDLAGPEPTGVRVDVGRRLARWLLDVLCPVPTPAGERG